MWEFGKLWHEAVISGWLSAWKLWMQIRALVLELGILIGWFESGHWNWNTGVGIILEYCTWTNNCEFNGTSSILMPWFKSTNQNSQTWLSMHSMIRESTNQNCQTWLSMYPTIRINQSKFPNLPIYVSNDSNQNCQTWLSMYLMIRINQSKLPNLAACVSSAWPQYPNTPLAAHTPWMKTIVQPTIWVGDRYPP